MKIIEKMLTNELQELKKLLEKAKKRIEKAPTGYLRVRKGRRAVEYYYRDAKENPRNVKSTNGRYLKKNERTLVEKLAQRDYDLLLLKKGEERVSAIERFLKVYGRTDLQEMYEKTNPLRRIVLKEAVLSDEEYVRRWQNTFYVGKTFEENAAEIITERGERVRSKSEKIIADKLHYLGIPYLYEKPLFLNGGIVVFPDFTILKMPEKREIYLEHFGMLQDETYADGTLQKMRTYERNGIYLGVNLLVTFETDKSPLNTRTLDDYFRQVFMT